MPAVSRWDVQWERRQRMPTVPSGAVQRGRRDSGCKLFSLYRRYNMHWHLQAVHWYVKQSVLRCGYLFRGGRSHIMPIVPHREVFRGWLADGVHCLPAREIRGFDKLCKLCGVHRLRYSYPLYGWHKFQAMQVHCDKRVLWIADVLLRGYRYNVPAMPSRTVWQRRRHRVRCAVSRGEVHEFRGV